MAGLSRASASSFRSVLRASRTLLKVSRAMERKAKSSNCGSTARIGARSTPAASAGGCSWNSVPRSATICWSSRSSSPSSSAACSSLRDHPAAEGHEVLGAARHAALAEACQTIGPVSLILDGIGHLRLLNSRESQREHRGGRRRPPGAVSDLRQTRCRGRGGAGAPCRAPPPRARRSRRRDRLPWPPCRGPGTVRRAVASRDGANGTASDRGSSRAGAGRCSGSPIWNAPSTSTAGCWD